MGDDMGNLSKEHRADALQADAWLRDSETLATTRAVPSRAPAPAAPKEEVRACVCDASVPCDDPLTTPLAVLRVSPSGAREFARVEEKGVRSAAARRDRAAGSPEAGQNDQARSRCSGKRY